MSCPGRREFGSVGPRVAAFETSGRFPTGKGRCFPARERRGFVPSPGLIRFGFRTTGKEK